jgi:hypothetical protein
VTDAPYTYASDDPLNETDPTGLCGTSEYAVLCPQLALAAAGAGTGAGTLSAAALLARAQLLQEAESATTIELGDVLDVLTIADIGLIGAAVAIPIVLGLMFEARILSTCPPIA